MATTPVSGTCSLAGPPVSFEPFPPGVPRSSVPTLGGGFSNSLALFGRRMLMSESFGYSVLDLADPMHPAALNYTDDRMPLGCLNCVNQGGDGQSNVQTLAVSPDGQRMALGLTGPTSNQTVVGSLNGYGWTLWADVPQYRPTGTMLQQINGRYIVYSIAGYGASAADVTVLPTDGLVPSPSEVAPWELGSGAMLAGNFIVYSGISGIQVINASNPGPVGSITAAMPRTVLTPADFGGRVIWSSTAYFDGAKLWVLVQLGARAPENSPSYSLVSVTPGMVKTIGALWRVPVASTVNPGTSSSIVNGYALIFAGTKVYSQAVGSWPGTPGSFDTTVPAGQPSRGFAAGGFVYLYIPTGQSAYVMALRCQ